MLMDHVMIGSSRSVSRCDYERIARHTGQTAEQVAAWALSSRLAETLTSCIVFEGEAFTLKDAYSVTTLVLGIRELEDMLDELELREIMELDGVSGYRLTAFGRKVANRLA